MVSEITWFYCKPEKTSSWFVISTPGGASGNFHDGFWKCDYDFLIAFYSNFLSGMHGFRYNKVLLPAGYDVIVISQPGGASATFYDGFWMSDHYFLIVINSNFLSAMHGVRDNVILLQAGEDVIVISTPGGASRDFAWRILKVRLWFPDSVP